MSSSVASPDSIHPCRWDWCRQVFDTCDRLARHVLDDHVANEIPVKREDIRLELRAFDGTSIGEDSIRTSLLMNDSVFLHDEEKENDLLLLKNGHSVHNSDHQGGVVNGSQDDLRIDPDSAPVALGDVEGVFSSNQSHDHRSRDTFQAPSPSPTSRSFGALTAASSPSPDPDSMAVARSPSLAEMVAKTINSVYSAQHVEEAGPSTIKPAAGLRQSRPPSSGRTEELDHPLSILGKRKSAEPQMGENLRPPSRTGSRPPSSHSHRTDRSRSRSAPNLPHRDTATSSQSVVEPGLSSIPEAADASVLQNGLHSDIQTSDVATPTVRPFRSGSIRLEPNLPPGETTDAEPPQGDTATQFPLHAELRAGDAHPQEPDKPFDGANSYIDDIDVLSSSLEPSIPAFTQAFDVQTQSLWPLATQAPYSFDSQLAFSSQ